VTRGAHPIDPAVEAAEIAVLSTVMLSADELARVRLEQRDFISLARGIIFAAQLHLWRSGDPVDLVTLRHELARTGMLERAGGDDVLHGLLDHIPTVDNIEHHAAIVLEASMRRRLAESAMALAALARQARSMTELRSDVARLADIVVGHDDSRTRIVHLSETTSAAIEDARERGERDERATMTTGLPALDDACDGWDRGDFVVIAGDSGAGKSSTMLAMARAQARAGERVLIVSLEDGAVRWGRRAISARAGVGVRALKRGPWSTVQRAAIDKAQAEIAGDAVWCSYPLGGNIDEVLAAIRRAIYVEQITIAYVDYLQAVDEGDDERELRHLIRKWLTALRRETAGGLVIAVGSQYRKREDDTKRPKDSDLYEANYIRQKADAILHLWRDGEGARHWFLSKHKDVDPMQGVLVRDESTGLLARADSAAVLGKNAPKGQQTFDDRAEFHDPPPDESWRSGYR
jgi:replicative DNA helicase